MSLKVKTWNLVSAITLSKPKGIQLWTSFSTTRARWETGVSLSEEIRKEIDKRIQPKKCTEMAWKIYKLATDEIEMEWVSFL